METHIVQEGECLSIIAFNNGFFVESLWNHESNASLRAQRDNPNLLAPGDQVNIPEKRQKEESVSVDGRHRFRLRGVPEKLRLCLKNGGEPRSGAPYRLTIDEQVSEGVTGGDGVLEHFLMPNASRASLYLPDTKEQFTVQLRRVEPVTETAGLQARLSNLDFYDGEIGGALGKGTKEALKSFQASVGLKATGKADQETQDALVEAHGC